MMMWEPHKYKINIIVIIDKKIILINYNNGTLLHYSQHGNLEELTATYNNNVKSLGLSSQ